MFRSCALLSFSIILALGKLQLDSIQEEEPVIPYDYPQTLPNKKVMVQLFEWKWSDIAKECEDFLQYYGYGAVQTSPPQEHIVLYEKNGDIPWWIVYQPVSYKLLSRFGTENEFKNMVERCNKVGVRIVVDVVLNHMVGVNQMYGKGRESSGGSYFDSTDREESFPEIPYCTSDTNDAVCDRDISDEDYRNSASNIRMCRLVGLVDLNQTSECVQGKMIQYLNKMIDMGVAGFRFDAAKHMFPKDLHSIIYQLHDLRTDVFGKGQRPFCAHEIYDQDGKGPIKAQEYFDQKIGRYTDFDYGDYITRIIQGKHKSFSDLRYWGPGYGYGQFNSTHVLAFIDNHDTQRNGQVLTYKDGDKYALAVGFMLSWNYAYPRVMSSYFFKSKDQGPPHMSNDVYQIRSPKVDLRYKTCSIESGWVCEHRWQAIRGMTLFRQNVRGAKMEIRHAQNQQLAISRGKKGFFAANNGDELWNVTLRTGLPPGKYCDVWSGELAGVKCTGKIIEVIKRRSYTHIEVPPHQFVAIHTGAKIGTVRA